MQKHFSITNAMRDKVADQLTVQAVAQHGPRIAADLAALNEQFWTKHCSAVEALPGLSKKHWPELIQAGAVAGTASENPYYLKPIEGRGPTRVALYCLFHEYNDDNRNALASTILSSEAYQGVRRFVGKNVHYDRHWALTLVSPTGTVPRLNSMDVITDPALETLALLCAQELQNVVKGAVAFREQALSVLQACRTSRQVEDLFPEAAKLLPEPVKNVKALAPTELAASVRSMLSQGVPPVAAQA